MTLNRRDQILKYIVEHFIKTAQPVGSQTLIEKYHLPYSSATIRNEMYTLEQMGLLEKTHSSSGRVPSSDGYRFYCEYLRDNEVEEELKLSLQKVLDEKTKSIESVIEESCNILSHMTSLASVVLGPNTSEEKLASIHLVPLSDHSVTIVFVTDKGYVENKTFVIPEGMSVQDVSDCVKMFTTRLIGTQISDLVNKMEAIKPILNDYIVGHDVIYRSLLETFVRFAKDRLLLIGKKELLSQPEFASNANEIKKLITLLESPDNFLDAEKGSSLNFNDGKLSIHIGSQNSKYPDVSIVSTKIDAGEGMGTIAIVGPTRMDYNKAVNSLLYIVEELSKYLKNEEGDE
jgi:heat-inducible transcriptional repressor